MDGAFSRRLRRKPVEFDRAALRRFFSGKRVLVTGAAGSVGGALAVQLAELDLAHLALLDNSDHGLLDIVERVRKLAPKLPCTEALADIRDTGRLNTWMTAVKPDVVLHCAALKHVHMGERHPVECLLTNLVGVRNTLTAAAGAGVSDFMLVSTDKAASPVCVMGATKRLAELYLDGFQRERPSAMRLKSVRFGNVFASQGSVEPRFKAQIAEGGPLEVTHPGMERFFMSSEEAVGLILSVTALDDGAAPRHGAYYMDMGEPVSILSLGREMIAESGKDIAIVYTGLRPGEKLKEELFDEYEVAAACALQDVFRVTPHSVHAYVTSADLAQLENSARTLEDSILRQRIFALLDMRLGRAESAVG